MLPGLPLAFLDVQPWQTRTTEALPRQRSRDGQRSGDRQRSQDGKSARRIAMPHEFGGRLILQSAGQLVAAPDNSFSPLEQHIHMSWRLLNRAISVKLEKSGGLSGPGLLEVFRVSPGLPNEPQSLKAKPLLTKSLSSPPKSPQTFDFGSLVPQPVTVDWGFLKTNAVASVHQGTVPLARWNYAVGVRGVGRARENSGRRGSGRDAKTGSLASIDLAAIDRAAILLGQPLRFYVRWHPNGGVPSSCAVVDYGEPLPTGIAHASLTARMPDSSEFKGNETNSPSVNSHQLTLRYSLSAYKAAKAVFQVSNIPFDESPLKWVDPAYNLSHEVLPVPEPGQTLETFAHIPGIDVDPGPAERTYYGRVVFLNTDGTLAANPSNVITVRVLQAQTPSAPPPPPKVVAQLSLDGYVPPYDYHPGDEYCYALTRTPTGDDYKAISKITGLKNLAEGDEVYLPPQPPEDKSWWDDVKDAVASIISKLNDILVPFETVMNDVAQGVLLLPGIFVGGIAAAFTGDQTYIDKAIEITQKAEGYANYPMIAPAYVSRGADYIANSMMDQLDLSDEQRALAFGNVRGAMVSWALQHRVTNPDLYGSQLLVASPQRQVRPAIVLLRLHTSVGQGGTGNERVDLGWTRLKIVSRYKDEVGVSHSEEVFDKDVRLGKWKAGEDVVIPVVMNYNWIHDARPDLWQQAFHSANLSKGLFYIGDTSTSASVINSWGSGTTWFDPKG